MEIVITENQYNRLLLKEEYLSLYKDNNLDIEVQGFDKRTGNFPLKPGEDGEIEMTVRSWVDKPIIFNFAKLSSLITNLKTKNTGKQSEVIRPNRFLDYTFTVPKTKTGTFTAGFTFVYEIVGSSTQVTKSINIPFYREGVKEVEERKNDCKDRVNLQHFRDAKWWWIKWLNDPSTKNRFAKTFGYDNRKVEGIFNEYIKKMAYTKILYMELNIPNAGAANPFYNTIIINCLKGPHDVLFFVHELGHILSGVHKFSDDSGPYSSDSIIPYIEHLSGKRGNTNIGDENLLIKKITSYGFSEELAKNLIGGYKIMLHNDLIHLESPNERLSTLFEVRLRLGLKPNEKITVQKLIENFKKIHEVQVFLYQWLHTGKTLPEFLNYNNSVAMNKGATNTDRNLA
jgi:hypothetical protein